MSDTLGTIRGQMVLDVKQALAAYTSARQAHISTVTALHTGAGALTMVGAGIAAAGVGIGAGIMTAVNAAAEFERKLDYFVAVSASTQAEYEAIRKKALQLGADTIYSADQIADSFVELGKAGVSAKDIVNGIGEGVANLAAAADIPLDTAAVIMMSAVQTFHLGADEAVKVADRLAGAANASIIDVQDLGVSLKYAGGVAAAAGIPFEDLNTAIAVLGQYGIRGSTAGTSLRKIILSLSGATPKATAALKDLGIITADGANKFYDAQGSAKPLAEIFDILKESTAGLTDKQKVSTLNTIFQNRALASAIALTSEGAAGFEEMAAAIEKTTALDVAGQRLDNLSGDLEILRGNLETLAITMGDTMQKPARALVQAITAVVGVFIDMPTWVLQSVMVFGTFASVALVVVGIAGMLAGAVLNLIALGTQLAPVLALLSSAIRGVASAMGALALASIKNPFFLIVSVLGLIIGAFITLYNTSETFRNAVQPLFSWMQTMFAALGPLVEMVLGKLVGFFSSIAEAAPGVLTGFLGILKSLADTLGGVLGSALSAVAPLIGFIADTFSSIFGPAVEAIIPVLKTLGEIITAVFSGDMAAIPALLQQGMDQYVNYISVVSTQVIPAIIQLVTDIIVAVIGMLPQLVQAGVTLLTGLVEAVTTVLPMVITALLLLLPQIINAIVSLVPQIIEAGIQLLMGLVQALVSMMPMLVEVFTTVLTTLIEAVATIIPVLVELIITLLPMIIQSIVSILPMLITAAISLFLGIVTGLVEALPQIIEAIVNAIPLLIEALVSMIPMLIEGAIQLFLGIITGLVTALPQIIVALITAIPKLIDAMVNMLPMIIDGAIQLFLGIITGLIEALPKIIEAVIASVPKIVDALIAAAPKLANAGVQLIQGLIGGIGSMGSALWDAATNIASKAVNAIKSFFGIHSPSRVFAQIGVYLIQGLIGGIGSMERLAVRSISSVASAIADIPFALTGWDDIQSSLMATKSLALTAPSIGVESAQAQSIDSLRDAIKEMKHETNYDIVVQNPEPETASESIPRSIRKLAYLG